MFSFLFFSLSFLMFAVMGQILMQCHISNMSTASRNKKKKKKKKKKREEPV